MILVTGATGNVGYRLLENLDDAAAPAAAMVRTDAGAVDLPPRVEHVVGALDDPPAPEALQQFDQVFLLSPDVRGRPRWRSSSSTPWSRRDIGHAS